MVLAGEPRPPPRAPTPRTGAPSPARPAGDTSHDSGSPPGTAGGSSRTGCPRRYRPVRCPPRPACRAAASAPPGPEARPSSTRWSAPSALCPPGSRHVSRAGNCSGSSEADSRVPSAAHCNRLSRGTNTLTTPESPGCPRRSRGADLPALPVHPEPGLAVVQAADHQVDSANRPRPRSVIVAARG